MTQSATQSLPQTSEKTEEPLNQRQLAFARELGVALAAGGRDDEILKAYEAAGYKSDRGNARRLAADPRVRSRALEACHDAAWRQGLHIEYLQAKAMELLDASPTRVFRRIAKFIKAETFGEGEAAVTRFRLRDDLSPEEESELDSTTWPLSEFKIDKDGIIAIKLPDKKALIEMLAKQLGFGKEDNSTTNIITLEALIAASMTQKTEEKAA